MATALSCAWLTERCTDVSSHRLDRVDVASGASGQPQAPGFSSQNSSNLLSGVPGAGSWSFSGLSGGGGAVEPPDSPGVVGGGGAVCV